MAIEHTIRLVEQEEDDAALDAQLHATLHEMGFDGWELVAVLPTGHTEAEDGGYAVSKMQLFFKRGHVEFSPRLKEVSERCGVDLRLENEKYAVVVIRFPLSWEGEAVELSGVGRTLRDHKTVVTGRYTSHGVVCSAVFQGIWMEDYEIDWGTKGYVRAAHAGKGIYREFAVYPGVVELDWTADLAG